MKKIILAGLILTYLILALFLLGCTKEPTGSTVAVSEAKLEGNQIKIPANQITNQLQKFEYDAQGITVRYFAVKGSDGKVRTAFDACDVCGGAFGYTQKGKDIACGKCGKVFYIDGLGTKNKGYGCWPSYLSHRIEGENLIINTEDLQKGAFRFN